MKVIKQSVIFKASPHDVYEALMDSKKHAKFTGAQAQISREVKGKFTAYDGWIEGENVQLVQDKKIVQKWRGKDWPEGHFSTATFELKQVSGGTELTFTQTNIPENQYDMVSEGWVEHYWTRMKKMLEK